MTAAELDEVCRDVFPMRATNDMASLEYVETTATDRWLRVVARLIVWDRDEHQTRSIRDVKEQEIGILEVGDTTTSTARLRDYLNALARVLAKALTHASVESLMPHDLLDTTPLRLKNATTEDDFVKALSARSRLGHLLPTATPRVLTGAELDTIFRAVFPVVGDGMALEYIGVESDGGVMRAVIRLGAVQQAIALFAANAALDVERLEAYVRALGRVVQPVLANARALSPSDLVDVSALQLASARTEDDFVKALSAKSRLGRFA